VPRLEKLPPYLFTAIDRARRAAVAAGRDVVDLGIGDPDRPTPDPLLETMAREIRRPEWHRYPENRGDDSFRGAVAAWFERRYGVALDPGSQVLALIGSKEGLAHLPLALLDEGDEVLVPDPGYPVYAAATLLAGGRPVPFRLRRERDFRPDPGELAGLAGERTRLLLVNYPNNPTGADAGDSLFPDLIRLARERRFVLANDAAYADVRFDGAAPVSLLQGADLERDPVVEFHSLSKTFNMTGWRVGFAVGNAEVVGSLERVKQNIDSGVFTAVQATAAAALGEGCADLAAGVMSVYPPRRRTILAALADAGVEVFPTAATFYVWARVPGDGDSLAFCSRVLEEHALVLTPGVGFGSGGEGWFRISLTAPDDRIDEAARRLRRL